MACISSAADTCRENGWTVGTRLSGAHGTGCIVIQITAIGDDLLLARQVEPVPLTESLWSLTIRQWTRVE
jgi:hypothetical protein